MLSLKFINCKPYIYYYSASFWALYGLSKKDNKILLVNVIGVTLMLIYTIVFYILTFKKSTVLRQFIIMAAFFFLSFGYTSSEQDNQRYIDKLGKSVLLNSFFFFRNFL